MKTLTANTKITLDEKVSQLFETGISSDKEIKFFREAAKPLAEVHLVEQYKLYLSDEMNVEGWAMGIGAPMSVQEFAEKLPNHFARYIQDELQKLYQ